MASEEGFAYAPERSAVFCFPYGAVASSATGHDVGQFVHEGVDEAVAVLGH